MKSSIEDAEDDGVGDSRQGESFHDAAEDIHSPTRARKKLVELKEETKQKSKRLMHALKPKHNREEDSATIDATHDFEESPAFDPSQLYPNQNMSVGGATDRVLGQVLATGKAIVSPKHAAKKKAAAKVAVQERPYLSQQADNDYVKAQADLTNAMSSNATSEDDHEQINAHKDRVQYLEDIRDARKVAWTTSRHVQRVAVVANQAPPPPDRADFYVRQGGPDHQTFDWQSYYHARGRYKFKKFAIESMGEIDVRPQEPFNKEVCIKYLERILIASAPWQAWFLSVRSIYRWENPRKTLKWAGIWFLIWYLDYVMTFVLGWMAFIVLENRFRKKRAKALEESLTRARDHGHTAFRFNELIHRHGPGEWYDPLIRELGPLAQMQLADLADFLEILANFYDWKDPFRTWGTLFWYACAFLVGVLTPTGYSWKIITMFALLAFFLSRPIASRHPQYRHAVNALKWIFWDIPTDAEWSFMYLRKKAQAMRENVIEQRVEEDYQDQEDTYYPTADNSHNPRISISTAPIDSDSDADSFTTAISTNSSTTPLSSLTQLDTSQPLQSFSTRYKTLPCRLLILPSGLTLRRTAPSPTPLFHIPWTSLRELRKFNSSTLSHLTTTSGIELVITTTLPNPPTQNPHSSNPELPDRHGATFASDSGAHRGSLHDTVDAHLMNEPVLQTIKLETLRNRDRAFNLILGFSGLKFQVLPPVTPSKEVKRERKKMEGKGKGRGMADIRGGHDDDGEEEDEDGEGRGGLGKEVMRRLKGESENRGKEPEAEYDAYQAFRKGGRWEGWFA
ncbi:hypothetical protein B9Z65_1893 [Elsinoe australis]|uniref:Uncharacterized protein n=1 Tax=Elsinoe australis TaxID=40998 RepID=A0A2P7YL76_9PEZI|nr:hypothetical protein B9Z65_1893 [Elsinoe australis]